jgi:hypothetical protein
VDDELMGWRRHRATAVHVPRPGRKRPDDRPGATADWLTSWRWAGRGDREAARRRELRRPGATGRASARDARRFRSAVLTFVSMGRNSPDGVSSRRGNPRSTPVCVVRTGLPRRSGPASRRLRPDCRPLVARSSPRRRAVGAG